MFSNYREEVERGEIYMWVLFLIVRHDVVRVLLTQNPAASFWCIPKFTSCFPKFVVAQPVCSSLNSHHIMSRIVSLKLCYRNQFVCKDPKTFKWPFLRLYRVKLKIQVGRMRTFSQVPLQPQIILGVIVAASATTQELNPFTLKSRV